MKRKIKTQPCTKCGAQLQPHWLKDGVCRGCTHPELIVEAEPGYNGWKNWETWNVALWIGNDEGLYQEARRFRNRGYEDFVKYMHEMGTDSARHGQAALIYYQTPDGVNWNDSGLDIEALNKMLEEL
jgi:hypothetical protein